MKFRHVLHIFFCKIILKTFNRLFRFKISNVLHLYVKIGSVLLHLLLECWKIYESFCPFKYAIYLQLLKLTDRKQRKYYKHLNFFLTLYLNLPWTFQEWDCYEYAINNNIYHQYQLHIITSHRVLKSLREGFYLSSCVLKGLP